MLGQRLAAIRRYHGISQAELATRMHISASAIGMYEQDRREPSLRTLVQLAEVFGVTTDYLLTGRPITESDADALRATIFPKAQCRRSRQLCRQNGFSKEELSVLFAAMLTEP